MLWWVLLGAEFPGVFDASSCANEKDAATAFDGEGVVLFDLRPGEMAMLNSGRCKAKSGLIEHFSDYGGTAPRDPWGAEHAECQGRLPAGWVAVADVVAPEA